MEITLAKKSGILFLKSKFFLYRALTYFSFLLIPVWLQKAVSLNTGIQCVLMIFYIIFMMSQWFFLGKEVDHRLKIYFRVNSSIDRVIYRVFLGMILFMLLFNVLNYLPGKWVNNIFWSIWVLLGLFYSWPTRGKIIQESVSSNFNEYKYLDSFERTLLLLIGLVFVFSVPLLSPLKTTTALKFFFDQNQVLSNVYWNFMTVNYYPFFKYPDLMKVAWGMHFYVVGGGLFFATLYALLRYFASRRLAILGVFSVISSWSFSKILASDVSNMVTTSYPLILIWAILWVTKSSTYRTGLFLGLILLYGVLVNVHNLFFVPTLYLVIYFVFLGEKTDWYKKRVLKYSIFGLLSIIGYGALIFKNANLDNSLSVEFFNAYTVTLNRKTFFLLHLIGLPLAVLKLFNANFKVLKHFKLKLSKLRELFIILIIVMLTAFLVDYKMFGKLSFMWVMALFSLLPLEMIFQAISRHRSKRNMIYLVYILICLLDSHLEGRVKILLNLIL